MNMAQSNQTSKAMSSRLSGMKFMQRASASTSSPPSTPPEPPPKKQRLSNGRYNSATSTPQSEPQAGEAVRSSGDQIPDRGDTRWYLSIKEPNPPAAESTLRVVSTGYATLDSTDSAIDKSETEDTELGNTPGVQGRRSFGKFNRKIEKQQDPEVSSSSDSSSDLDSNRHNNEEDVSDDPTGAKAMIAASRKEAGDKARAERKAKKTAVRADAERLADERRKKRVKLNPKLTSISGAGSSRHG